MKAIPALSFVAALVAFILFPVRFEIAASILFAAGFATIAFGDYARRARRLPATTIGATTLSRRERFGLAA